MRLSRNLLLTLVLALLTAPADARAQAYSAIGAGLAVPTGDLDDVSDPGFTVRGQVGFSLITVVDLHLQAGWSRFSGQEYEFGGETVEGDDLDLYHAGVGARVGLGVIWIGAAAVYAFGDGVEDRDLDSDGIGVLPEVGLGLGPIELVADYLIHADVDWLGVRAALRF